MGIFRASEFWNAPSPGDTQTYHVTAGVTRVTAVQITNSSGGELWLRQGSIAPKTADDADFVVPPRATGNYPLDVEQVSVRWNGQVSSLTDFIAFSFTDQVVTPAVYPGVEPVQFPSPLVSPVQKLSYQSGTLPGGSVPITTTSGKNIGSVFIYNRTERSVTLFVSGGALQLTVPAYSWITLPVNEPSIAFFVLANPYTTPTYNEDSLFIAWSDIDYVGPFPSGGGKLPPPKSPYGLQYTHTGFLTEDFTSSTISPRDVGSALPSVAGGGYWEIVTATITLSVHAAAGVTVADAWFFVAQGLVGGPHLSLGRIRLRPPGAGDTLTATVPLSAPLTLPGSSGANSKVQVEVVMGGGAGVASVSASFVAQIRN